MWDVVACVDSGSNHYQFKVTSSTRGCECVLSRTAQLAQFAAKLLAVLKDATPAFFNEGVEFVAEVFHALFEVFERNVNCWEAREGGVVVGGLLWWCGLACAEGGGRGGEGGWCECCHCRGAVLGIWRCLSTKSDVAVTREGCGR